MFKMGPHSRDPVPALHHGWPGPCLRSGVAWRKGGPYKGASWVPHDTLTAERPSKQKVGFTPSSACQRVSCSGQCSSSTPVNIVKAAEPGVVRTASSQTEPAGPKWGRVRGVSPATRGPHPPHFQHSPSSHHPPSQPAFWSPQLCWWSEPQGLLRRKPPVRQPWPGRSAPAALSQTLTLVWFTRSCVLAARQECLVPGGGGGTCT